MPFKSEAQIAKFRQLVKEGKMSQKTFDEWLAATPNPGSLPSKLPQKNTWGRVKTVKKAGKI